MDGQNQNFRAAPDSNNPNRTEPVVITPTSPQTTSSMPPSAAPVQFSPQETVQLSPAPPSTPVPTSQTIAQPTTAAASAPDPAPTTTPAVPATTYPRYDDDVEPLYANESVLDSDDIPYEISWTAPEFAAHPKQPSWYVVLAIITIIVAILAFIISDIVTAIVILACATMFGFMASRTPRDYNYALGTTNITVGSKQYPYSDFRAFSTFEDGNHHSIDLAPLKRFAPTLTISYNRENEDQILDILTQHLPFSPHQRTAIDQLMHRIGF